MSDYLMYFNFIVVPLYCFLRFRKKSYLSLLNPCFYLLIFSYFYLTISSVFLNQYINLFKPLRPWFFAFKIEDIQITNLYCNWFTLVFFVFYVISVDKKIVPVAFIPKKITYKISLIFTLIITLMLFIILIINAPSLINENLNRASGLAFYKEEIADKYKTGYFINILLASLAVVVWRTKNFKWYIVLLIPITIELLTKGRTQSFAIIVFAYINYLAITKKPNILKISILITALISTIFFRIDINNSSSFYQPIFNLLSEVFETRTTTIIVCDKLMSSGNLEEYLFYSILDIMPSAISNIFMEEPDKYTLILKDFYQTRYGINYGLAGNIVSESLFYGGATFAILSPIIIGGIFYALHKFMIYKTFPGFIFFCFLISRLQIFTRSSFYDNFLTLVWLMSSYLIWITILEKGKIIFMVINKSRVV